MTPRVDSQTAVSSRWATIVSHWEGLLARIKTLFRKIVLYFSAYGTLDLEQRLAKLVSQHQVKNITCDVKSRLLSYLNFEADELLKRTDSGLEEFYEGLALFRAALVHACACKKFGEKIAEELADPFTRSPYPLKEGIYERLLERFSEERRLRFLEEGAMREIRKGDRGPDAVLRVVEGLKDAGALAEEKFDDFATALAKRAGIEEKKDRLTTQLNHVIARQKMLETFENNLNSYHEEKEKRLKELFEVDCPLAQMMEEAMKFTTRNDFEAKRLEMLRCLREIDRLEGDIGALPQQIQERREEVAKLKSERREEIEGLNEDQKREIQMLEREIQMHHRISQRMQGRLQIDGQILAQVIDYLRGIPQPEELVRASQTEQPERRGAPSGASGLH